MQPDRLETPGGSCCLCGNTDPAGLGQVVSVCLDAGACLRRQAAREVPSCWCCGQHGLSVPADSPDGLCATCGGRPPSACQRAHGRDAAARAAMAAEVRGGQR